MNTSRTINRLDIETLRGIVGGWIDLCVRDHPLRLAGLVKGRETAPAATEAGKALLQACQGLAVRGDYWHAEAHRLQAAERLETAEAYPEPTDDIAALRKEVEEWTTARDTFFERLSAREKAEICPLEYGLVYIERDQVADAVAAPSTGLCPRGEEP